ncbi:hypothetical protein J1614_004068 [Plenodomus biglobosus]|nr:hypothetical protein J1614_004068 [Plenodomus biglobosus]
MASVNRDPPASHVLTQEHVQRWKNTTKAIKTGYSSVNMWPCMYCYTSTDCSNGETLFRCQNEECGGRGKLQVTCYHRVTVSPKYKEDKDCKRA